VSEEDIPREGEISDIVEPISEEGDMRVDTEEVSIEGEETPIVEEVATNSEGVVVTIEPPVMVTVENYEIFAQKAREMLDLYNVDPEAARRFISATIESVYGGIISLQNEMGEVMRLVGQIRSDGVGAITKARLAKKAEKMMKEVVKRHKPFFDNMKERQPVITAVLMFTIKPEFIQDMEKIINLFISTVKAFESA